MTHPPSDHVAPSATSDRVEPRQCPNSMKGGVCEEAPTAPAPDEERAPAGARSERSPLLHPWQRSSEHLTAPMHAFERCAGTGPVDRRAAASREAVVSREPRRTLARDEHRRGAPATPDSYCRRRKQASSLDSTAWSGARPATRGRTRSVDQSATVDRDAPTGRVRA